MQTCLLVISDDNDDYKGNYTRQSPPSLIFIFGYKAIK